MAIVEKASLLGIRDNFMTSMFIKEVKHFLVANDVKVIKHLNELV